MSKPKDTLEKVLVAYNDVFAQCWNRLGKTQIPLDPDGLEDAPTEGIVLANPQPVQGIRDVLKRYKDKASFQLIYLGLENQTLVDKYMPIRILNYTGQTYDLQRRQNVAQISPVFTRVLYFGYEKRWDGPRSMRELVGDVPAELETEFMDFTFDVIELAWLSDEETDRLENDLRALALFLRDLRLKRVPTGSSDVLKHGVELLALIKAISAIDLTESYTYEDIPEGGVAMCEFFESWKKELIENALLAKQREHELDLQAARLEGEQQRKEGIGEGWNAGRQSIAANMRALGFSEADVQRVLAV